jgi:hypothetical protein
MGNTPLSGACPWARAKTILLPSGETLQPQKSPCASVASFPLAKSIVTSSSAASPSPDSVVTIRVESGDHLTGQPTSAFRARAFAPGSVETMYVSSQLDDGSLQDGA